ncbi:MAG: hypothetical protein HS124_09340 [Anaerolineales bacterium]|nr:hypothetical protein [Anaerolineales bacterium]MCL4260878.1 hypothetical protein [Anaerolineales bacterium]
MNKITLAKTKPTQLGKLAALFILVLFVIGCGFLSPTPTAQPILADSAFSGYAFLDSNFNGQLDDEDTPLEGATFYVAIDGVKAFGETTDKNGYAFILIPSSVDYPVTLSMDAPKESNLDHAGFSEVVMYSSTDPAPKFLFTSK